MQRVSIGRRLGRRWMLLVAVAVAVVVVADSRCTGCTAASAPELFWIVLALAVILLLAVGSDYNLLLISRFKEEIGVGVTAAGLVFAATMASLMTPAVAALLGRWFWWPLRVRPRPASQTLQPYGSRQSVRQLLLWEDGDPAISRGASPS